MPPRSTAALALVAHLMGCGGEDTSPCTEGSCGGSEPVETCLAPNRVVDGQCLSPGVQDDGCAAGSFDPGDGTCRPAGIPPELCGMGFVAQDDGCAPLLPDEPCTGATMALPGETTCRPVAPCGDGTWGDIPVEPDTVYVDASFPGVSDGSAAAPFVTVGEGIAAAPPGAIVAIAEGSYVETLAINRSVRLWGRCPAMVELVGAAGDATVYIQAAGDGAELHRLALTGGDLGLLIGGAAGVVVDRLWVHDVGGVGIDAELAYGDTSVTIQDTLVDNVIDVGIFVSGANATIARTEVRDTQPIAGIWGRGIHVQRRQDLDVTPVVHVSEALLDRNHEIALASRGAEITMTDVVIRDTLPRPATDGDGWGVAFTTGDANEPSRATLQRVHVSGSHELGMDIRGSEVVAEAVTIRDTKPHAATSDDGVGLQVGPASDGTPSQLHLRGALLAGNHNAGLVSVDSFLTLEGIIIRDTQPQVSDATSGRGAQLANTSDTPFPTASLVGSVIEHNRYVGLVAFDAPVTVVGTRFSDTLAQLSDGRGGSALGLQSAANGLIAASVIDHSVDTSILVWSAMATVQSSVIDTTEPTDGLFGDGIVVVESGHVDVASCRVASSTRVGVGVWGATASLTDSALECNKIDLGQEAFDTLEGSIEDGSGNDCGCGDQTKTCKVLTTGLLPPDRPE